MAKRPGEQVSATITVRDSTGAAVDPASPPTCVLRRNSDGTTDVAATVAKGSLPTGQYRATATIPSGWAAGDKWELISSVVVETIPDSAVEDAGYLDGSPVIAVTVPAAVAAASQSIELITAVRGDTLVRNLPPLGNIAGRTKLVWTLKRRHDDTDEQAMAQVEEGVGLTRFNGAAPSSAGLGSLVVTDQATGASVLTLDKTLMAVLPIANGWVWDEQFWDASGNTDTPTQNGRWALAPDVTRAT